MSAATAFLMHVLNIARGIMAALACAGVLYIVGSAIVPRRWDKSVGRGESPAILGAALYVLLCWFGVAFGVPVERLAIIFGGVALVLAVARRRWLLAAFTARGAFARGAAGWLLAFILLYVLAYVFTMPPVSADYLPLAWTGNIDLLTYVRYTKYFMRLGPANLPGFSYLTHLPSDTGSVLSARALSGSSPEPLRAAARYHHLADRRLLRSHRARGLPVTERRSSGDCVHRRLRAVLSIHHWRLLSVDADVHAGSAVPGVDDCYGWFAGFAGFQRVPGVLRRGTRDSVRGCVHPAAVLVPLPVAGGGCGAGGRNRLEIRRRPPVDQSTSGRLA